MAALLSCGEWLVSCCEQRLLAVHSGQDRVPFEFDCGSAEKRPMKTDSDAKVDENEMGCDRILAMAASASGKLLALSDDSKRLILLRNDMSWSVISVRWLFRRCTALVFTRSEEQLLAADKSGDVYSLSVENPLQEPRLQLGHLSMVLDVTVSLDDRFIVTCDRDEKIRVSLATSPSDIQSFCLGHQQFVSALLVPVGSPHSLLSGSGDGTVKLWDLESGRQVQSVDLRAFVKPLEQDKEQRLTVSKLLNCPQTPLVAVLCEKVKEVQLFCLQQTEKGTVLLPHSQLPCTHYPLDMTFDPKGWLWVLVNSEDHPLQVYSQVQGSWEKVDTQNEDVVRVTANFMMLWETVDEYSRSGSQLEHLYVETYDNVSEYMRKKQLRLEEQSQKKRHHQNQGHNQYKKAKTNPTSS